MTRKHGKNMAHYLFPNEWKAINQLLDFIAKIMFKKTVSEDDAKQTIADSKTFL